MPNIFRKFQRWIDGEQLHEQEFIKERKIEDKEKSELESFEFLKKIISKLKLEMKRHFFPISDNSDYQPSSYIILISNEDEKMWIGEKLLAMKSFLSEEASKIAKEIGENIKNQSIKIDVRIDGTLNKGQFEVRASNESPKTDTAEFNKKLSKQNIKRKSESLEKETIILNEAEEKPTIIISESLTKSDFTLEIWQNGIQKHKTSVVKPEITIGRGKAADIRLETESLEISRVHILARLISENEWLIKNVGKNSIMVAGKKISSEDEEKINGNCGINISDFEVKFIFN